MGSRKGSASRRMASNSAASAWRPHLVQQLRGLRGELQVIRAAARAARARRRRPPGDPPGRGRARRRGWSRTARRSGVRLLLGGVLVPGGQLRQPAVALQQLRQQRLGLGQRAVPAQRLAQEALRLLESDSTPRCSRASRSSTAPLLLRSCLQRQRALQPAGLRGRIVTALGERRAHPRRLEVRRQREGALQGLLGRGRIQLHVAQQLRAAALAGGGRRRLAPATPAGPASRQRLERVVRAAGVLGEPGLLAVGGEAASSVLRPGR